MNHHLKLGLAIGAGAIGLVLLHALIAGQHPAASAVQMGATLSAPFAVSTDAGALANGVAVSNSTSTAATSPNPVVVLNPPPAESAPNGINASGWEVAIGGMQSLAAGTPPWAAISQGTLP